MIEYITKEQAWEVVKIVARHGGVDSIINADKRLANMPAADVVEVVRCKDCKHSNQYGDGCWHCEKYEGLFSAVNPNDYCSYGWDGEEE